MRNYQMNKKWEKRFDEWYAANFIDETRKQEKEIIKTYLAKQRTKLLARVREEVIGKYEGHDNISSYAIDAFREEKLKKLRELADD